MVIVLIVLLYCVCCLCAGSLLMRLLWLRTWDNAPVRSVPFMATAFLLGQAALANLWLLLGLQSRLNQTTVLLVLPSVMVAGAPFARRGISGLPARMREEIRWWSQQRVILRLIIVASLLAFMLFGIAAFLNPPVDDAEAFYMVYSKIIAASERIIPLPTYWSFSQMGLIGETHFAVLIQLSGVQAAKLFVWPVSLAAAIMLMGVAAESGVGRIGQWFAVIILLSSSAFTKHISDGKVDLFGAGLGIAAFYWALKASGHAWRKAALAITGLCTGFAVVAKLSYLVAVVPSIFLLVMSRQYISEVRTRGRTVLSICSVVVQLALWTTIAVIPHVIKNDLFFGAPLTPLIGPPELTGFTDQVWFSPETTRWIVLTYPYALTFGHYHMQEGRVSFLLLVFLLLALALPRAKPIMHSALAQITMVALLGTVLWVFLKPSVVAPRYILPTLLMFVPLAARAAEYVYQSETKSRRAWTAVIGFLMLALVKDTYRPLTKWPFYLVRYAKGGFSQCELASEYCPSLAAVNQLAAPGTRIYFAGYYSFWLRADLLQCRQARADEKVLASSKTMSGKWADLFAHGFEYVIIDKATHRSELASLDKSAAPAWMEREKILEDRRLLIYKIKSKDERRSAKAACRQISGPAWDVVELQRESRLN